MLVRLVQDGAFYNIEKNTYFTLEPEKPIKIKAYTDIDTEITDLSSPIKVTFSVPNGDNDTKTFTYIVGE